MRDSATPSPLARRLAAYSATAGAALALAPAASGQIVYTDEDPDNVIVTGQEILLDLDGDGTDDFRFVANSGGAGATTARVVWRNANTAASNGVAGVDAPYFSNEAIGSASNLAAGAEVGPAAGIYSYGVIASLYGGTPYYNFTGAEGYVGFRFVAGGGTTHYGWARISGTANAGSATLFEYAFQSTPDTPITTGDIGVAVEPDALPDGYVFSPIGPNPIRSSAQFTVQVAEPEAVRVSVYDLLGREVAEIFDGELASGVARRMELNAGALPSGTYVVRVTGESFDTVRRVSVAR